MFGLAVIGCGGRDRRAGDVSAYLSHSRERRNPTLDHIPGDRQLLEVGQRRNLVHDVEHQLLENDAQTAGAHLAGDGLLGHRSRGRPASKLSSTPSKPRTVSYWRTRAVLGFGENPHQGIVVEFVQGRHDRNPADELGDHAVLDEILGVDLLEQLVGASGSLPDRSAPKPIIF